MYSPLKYNTINQIEFHKTKSEIADHATNRLLGQGYTVNILRNGQDAKELEDIWARIEKENNFRQFMLKVEFQLSYYGNAIVMIYKTKTNKIRVGLADPKFYNEVARVNMIDNIAAITHRRYRLDSTDFYIREYWDEKQVTRTLWADEKNTQQIVLQDFNKKIPEQYQIKEKEIHNLGIIPVHLILNKQRDVKSLIRYNSLSDTFTVENQIKALNTLRATQLREAVLNTTKIFGNFDESTILRMANSNKQIEEAVLRDVFVQVSRGDANNSNMVEILQANPKLEIYDNAIQNMLRNIWRGAGYTYVQSGDTMSGNAETLYANSADIATTKLKRDLRQIEYAEIIRKILICDKSISPNDEIDILVNIKENVVQSPSQVVDQYLRLNEAGLLSRERVLQKIEQIPNLEQAKSLVNEAQEEASKDMEQSYQQQKQLGVNEFAESYEPKEIKKSEVV